MKERPNTKRNELNTHGVELINVLEFDDGEPIFGNLKGCIEVASYLTFPNRYIEEGGSETRYNAFMFVWWFEALEKVLDDLCLASEEVQILFDSKDKLKYCIVVNATSEPEAAEIFDKIPCMVSDMLTKKIDNAEEKYWLSMIKEIEE